MSINWQTDIAAPLSEAGRPTAGSHLSDWVAIQRNRHSGAGRQYRAIVELIRELRRCGLRPQLFGRRELLAAAIARAPRPPAAIVACGGDGTVLDVLNRHLSSPVAILPLGTENLLARHLGIPRRDGSFVARMIAEGRTRRIDLGRIGERRFAIVASVGFDADVLHRTHAARSGPITHRVYFAPFCRSLITYRFPEIRVYVDDRPDPYRGGLVLVANVPEYALRLPLAPHARPDDGLLDVRILPHRSPFQFARDLGKLLLRRDALDGSAQALQATRVRIESDQPLPVQADGDPVGFTPVEIIVEPQAATLFVP